jgi:aspartyl protease family protein
MYSLLCILLVGSALLSRRLPIGQTLRMALAWVGIFAVAFVLFTFRGEAGAIWQRLTADFRPDTAQIENGTVRVRIGPDGHFHVKALLNGQETLFMIDSGATSTTLSDGAATQARLDVDETGFPVIVETANGTASARRARIERFSLGPITRTDMPALVSNGLGETNLLGMDFLSSLKGWRVERDTMILNP